MPSKLKHIDDFLRDKDEASKVNDSRMEADWHNMRQLLIPSSIVPAKKTARLVSTKRYLAYAASATLVVTIAAFVLLPIKKKKTLGTIKPVAVKTGQTKSATGSSFLSRESSVLPDISTDDDKLTTKLLKIATTKTNQQKVVHTTIPLNPSHEKVKEREVSLAVTIPEPEKPSSKTVFEAFYSELQKPTQRFLVDSKRDTTLFCEEGTTVFVPAACFQTTSGLLITSIVKISIQEFYNIADIIANKLTTLSNGQPLITGGMLNIQATTENNEPVQIKPGANINLQMPTRSFDPEMQLFVANTPSFASLPVIGSTDTISYNNTDIPRDGINWMAMGQRQVYINDKYKKIKILNLMDNPSMIEGDGKKVKARFRIPYDCALTASQIKAELEKRYGNYYDKIKVKRAATPLWKKNRISTNSHDWYESLTVGDSITIPLDIATRQKLITRQDSIRYEGEFQKKYDEAKRNNQAYAEYLQIREKYDFRISNLGWINCDRFYNYPGSQLTDFIVNTGKQIDTKETYVQTILILNKERSVLPGDWHNGRISFPKLPAGMEVNVVCVAAKDGKVLGSVQKFTVTKDQKYELKLEEVTPEQFKDKLRPFGSVTSPR